MRSHNNLKTLYLHAEPGDLNTYTSGQMPSFFMGIFPRSCWTQSFYGWKRNGMMERRENKPQETQFNRVMGWDALAPESGR